MPKKKPNKSQTSPPSLSVSLGSAALNDPSEENAVKTTTDTSGVDLLKVPTPLLFPTDNTPTPVRTLLRDFEANGLSFQVWRKTWEMYLFLQSMT